MADINLVSRLINAVQRNVDLQQNSLVVGSLKVGTTSPVELTKTILTNLIALQNGSDFSNGTNSHTHDGRYFTETELGSTSGTSGAQLIGVKSTATNFTPGSANVEAWLTGIDSALAAAGSSDFADDIFRISDNTTPSKKIAFQASGISSSTVRTITMPDADVNLGALTNSNIDAAAAIAYSKLNLALSIVNGDINASAAIAYSKLNLTSSIVNADINASAAIAYSKLNLASSIVNADVNAAAAIVESKLSLDFSTSSLNTAIGLRALDADVIKKDGSVAFTANQSMGSFKLTNLSNPTSAQDAATKSYVDGVLDGRTWKNSVKAATTAPLTLASDFENADVIDGYTLATGDRILIKDQASAAENGIYIVQASGAPVRASDADSATKLLGAAVFVEQGTANGDKQYAQSGDGATFAINSLWVVTSANSFSGHDMVSLSGGQISVDLASDAGLESSNAGNAAGQLRVKLDGSTLARSSSGLKVATGGIANNEIDAAAAIAYSKLNLGGNIVNADISGSAAIAYSKLNLSTSIVNADISGSAAIAYSKLNLASSIVNADISGSAAIAYSKLNLSTSIVNADINASAAIAYSKLNLSASIVNADIASGANIAYNKLVLTNSITNADLTTGVADQSTITGGNGSSLAVQHAPAMQGSEVAGEAFAASLFAVRLAKAADAGFVAGRVYKADKNASSSDNFYVIGLSNAAASAGSALAVVKMGPMTVTGHGFTIGQPLFLDAAGAVTGTAPSAAGEAVVRVGFAKTANVIEVQIQVMGIN